MSSDMRSVPDLNTHYDGRPMGGSKLGA